MFKKLLALVLSATMLMGMGTTAFAQNTSSNEDVNVFEIFNSIENDATAISMGDEMTRTVTDPVIIAQLSDDEELPSRIELTYIPTNADTYSAVSPILFESYEIRNKTDHGDGWYNSTAHQLYEFYIDGPDTFKISKKETYDSSVNCNISGAMEVIEAGVGFEMGVGQELEIQSNTPVAAGERLHVEIFRTHHKVTFDLYEKPLGGNWSKEGSYEAIDPNGIFIKKEFWRPAMKSQ